MLMNFSGIFAGPYSRHTDSSLPNQGFSGQGVQRLGSQSQLIEESLPKRPDIVYIHYLFSLRAREPFTTSLIHPLSPQMQPHVGSLLVLRLFRTNMLQSVNCDCSFACIPPISARHSPPQQYPLPPFVTQLWSLSHEMNCQSHWQLQLPSKRCWLISWATMLQQNPWR
jgi:hypothetical protein